MRVSAFGGGQYRAVVFAEGQQGLFVAQAFQQGQAQGLARTFVLPGGVFHAAVVEGLGLVVIAGGDKGQGVGKSVFTAVQAGAQGVQVSHWGFPLANAACCSALASFW